ncbi:unnamed protein product [Effrenium voratum]|nr:unnamed protein product [Effrenium voratum]
MLTWAAWGLLLLGVCAVPADPPGSIAISVPGEEGFVLAWVPGAANDCSFQEWLVQLRSRNLNGTLVGFWRTVSCEEAPRGVGGGGFL